LVLLQLMYGADSENVERIKKIGTALRLFADTEKEGKVEDE